MNKSESQQTISSASFIGLAGLGGALVGLVLQQLVAYHFGASATTDAFFMAQSTSELLSKLLLGGSITSVFLPIFVERLTRGQTQTAWRLGLNILHLTSGLFLAVILILAIFAEPFVRFIAPGFDPDTTQLTVMLLRILLPSFLFLFLVDMATAMLHSLKHFAVPALLRVVAPLTSLISILALANHIGIYAYAVGVVTGSVLQLLLVMTTLHRKGFRYSFVADVTDPTIRRLIHLTYPFLLSAGVTQAAGIVYRILVSELSSGSLSALKFSEKITQLLTIMFLTSVTFVIFPTLSQKAADKNYRGMRDTMASAIRLITFVTVPVILGVALLRQPLITVLFQYGSFSERDAALTSIALLFLVIGLTTNGISSVLGYATLALQETRASVAVTVASQAVAIFLFVLLVPLLGHAGLALGSSLVPLAIALLYFLYLSRFIDRLAHIFWHPVYLKIVALAAGLTLAVIGAQSLTRTLVLPTHLHAITELVVATAAGSLVFFGGAYLWHISEIHDVAAITRTRFAKWRGENSKK